MNPIVVDANIVFAAFIQDGATREVILDRNLDLRTPPWLWDEVAARYDWLAEKTGVPRPALDELLRQIRERIIDVPEAAIQAHREGALEQAGQSGRKDAPYIAAVLAVDGTLWTQDKQLAKEASVETISTATLLETMEP